VLDVKQFRDLILKPVLHRLELYSPAAEVLMLGTAAHESLFTYLAQLGGPARGIYQIEPATHADLMYHWLAYRPKTANKVRALASNAPELDLIGNLPYQTAIARLIYYRCPEPLPDADDLTALSIYWKQHYNTSAGRGTAAEWIESFNHVITPIL